jgi:N-acyl-L-homoserine lactone synthetase
MSAYSVVLFYSTAHAIRAEKVLQRAGFAIKMIPTPRQISSDCGVALRFDPTDQEAVAATLQENKVPINGIHTI